MDGTPLALFHHPSAAISGHFDTIDHLTIEACRGMQRAPLGMSPRRAFPLFIVGLAIFETGVTLPGLSPHGAEDAQAHCVETIEMTPEGEESTSTNHSGRRRLQEVR